MIQITLICDECGESVEEDDSTARGVSDHVPEDLVDQWGWGWDPGNLSRLLCGVCRDEIDDEDER